ncbi:hypothetical protein [Chryseobacterium sp. CT-SW4]|uniref:hypothetical protein n=1 Tax=Chryseobacterium sp. SW-1 TaxID=3157343 RepID=UPI003B020D12
MSQPCLYFFRNQIHFLKESFIIDNEELLNEFNSSVEQFCYFTLEMDKIIDNDYDYSQPDEPDKNIPYLATKSHLEAVKGLSKIFPEEHLFWKILDEHSLQYYSALLKEKQNAEQQLPLSLQHFEEYAINKHSLAYVPILGLDFLFTSTHPVDILKDIHSCIFKGIQMNDDIEDLQSDTTHNQWTYARSRVQDFIQTHALSNTHNLERFEERVLYISGIATELSLYSRENFARARNRAHEFKLQNITLWLDGILTHMDENIQLIESLIKN